MSAVTVEQIRAQYPYLSDVPDSIIDDYREAEAARILRIESAGECVECGADCYGDTCPSCTVMIERQYAAGWEA